jgi:signal transduction histidine kinase
MNHDNETRRVEAVKGIGAVLVNATLYGLYHGITVKSMEACFECLGACLAADGLVAISLLPDGQWMVGGTSVETKNQFAVRCEETLRRLDVAGLVFKTGLPENEFVDLMTRLVEAAGSPDKGKAVVTDLGAGHFPHVSVKRSVYREVAEDEVVVAEDKVRGGGGEAEGAREEAAERAAVDEIMLFLRSPGSREAPDSIQSIDGAAARAESLSEMILQSVDVKPGSLDLAGGETLGELVVGCLKRTVDGITKDPAIKTQKGKNTVRKTLAVIEESLVNRLREMGDVGHERAGEMIAEAAEEMREDLQMDSVISQYMKRRKALEDSEERMFAMMRRAGRDKLESLGIDERLTAEGLSPSGWNQMVIRSGADRATSVVGGSADTGLLAALLASLTEAIEKQADAAGGELDQAIREVEAEVDRVSTDAEARIDALTKSIQEEKAGRESRGEEASPTDDLIKTLAEINQELCQPLAVLNCSIDMLHQGHLGDLTEPQQHTLTLASDSGRRLQHLVDKLSHIAGLPAELSPDQQVLAKLYESNHDTK